MRAGLQDVQFLAWFEADSFSRRDADFSTGTWIAANACFAGTYAEDTESTQLDAITRCQGLLKPLEDRIYSRFRLGPRQAGPLDDVMDYILLDQCRRPLTKENFGVFLQRPTGEMLLGVGSVVNLCVLQYHKQLRHYVSALPSPARICMLETGLSGREEYVKMSIQSDRWIREQALQHGMIEPFSEKQVREGVISYGLSSYGYDLRVSDEFKIFTNVNSAIIDPKAFDERSFVSVQAESVIVPPNSFALARSVEYFRIPRDVLSVCVGKSTYARCGIIVNVTPFEPEWEGFVTLEISNTTPLPARVYANEGLCQILFFRGSEPCEVSYADRKGKYQKQQGIVLPRL